MIKHLKNFLKFFVTVFIIVIFIKDLREYFFQIIFYYIIFVILLEFYKKYKRLQKQKRKNENTIKNIYHYIPKTDFDFTVITTNLVSNNWGEDLDEEDKQMRKYGYGTGEKHFWYKSIYFKPCTIFLAEKDDALKKYQENLGSTIISNYYIKIEDSILTRIPLKASKDIYTLSNKKREIPAKLFVSGGPYAQRIDTVEGLDLKYFPKEPFKITIEFEILTENKTYRFELRNEDLTEY